MNATATKVVTWQDSSGNQIDICEDCERRMKANGTWPRTQYSEYCSVSRGLHHGKCQMRAHAK